MNPLNKKIFFIRSKIIKEPETQHDFKENIKMPVWKFLEYVKYLIVREVNFYKM